MTEVDVHTGRVTPGDVKSSGDELLRLPAEAWLRLTFGRLTTDHTPPAVTLTGDAVTLDDLRRVFPGI